MCLKKKKLVKFGSGLWQVPPGRVRGKTRTHRLGPGRPAMLCSGAAVLSSGAAISFSGPAVSPLGAAISYSGKAVSYSGTADSSSGAADSSTRAADLSTGAAIHLQERFHSQMLSNAVRVSIH